MELQNLAAFPYQLIQLFCDRLLDADVREFVEANVSFSMRSIAFDPRPSLLGNS
jgi:hypothetical protein